MMKSADYSIARKFFLIGLMLFFTGVHCQAAEIKGVRFADSAVLEKAELRLKGIAVLKWAMLFDVYAGAFYMPATTPAGRWPEDVPKRLELSYFRDIEGQGFVDASDKLLRDNLTPAEYQVLADRLQVFYGFFKDVKIGDRYSINYLPEYGTELRLNEQPLGHVPGADFAAAYFGIWLGSDPINKSFRDRLLDDN